MGDGAGYQDMVIVGEGVHVADVTGLLPGSSYDIRILATNKAGATSSDAITIATNATSMSTHT